MPKAILFLVFIVLVPHESLGTACTRPGGSECPGGSYCSYGYCSKCRCSYQNYYAQGCGGGYEGDCMRCTSCSQGSYNVGCGEFNGSGISAGNCSSCNSTCPTGQFAKDCGGSSKGICTNCSDDCKPGTYFSGCFGASKGECTPCACPDDMYASGCGKSGVWTCINCSCPVGQYAYGCGRSYGNYGPGTCKKCLTCPDGKYVPGCTGASSGLVKCPYYTFYTSSSSASSMWTPGYAFISLLLLFFLIPTAFQTLYGIYLQRQFTAAEILRETKLTEQGLVFARLKNTTANVVQVT
jgi:hypothetical protein